ncbi:MSCRAMM family protein [Streptococcus catagoni]|uniref:MSCRAMM family protein n=1 Tax=Streptococcus catagoni TaxID=2654874 RepID=UPI00140E2C2E|nr:LPXTG cell wall anchor domain-containing protein [Streptococcus catagoni]
MKRSSLISLVTVATLGSSFLLVPMDSVKAEETSPKLISQPQQGFSFTVTVLGGNGKTLSNQEVTLFDVTSGRVEHARGLTDKSGRVVFTNLPLSHNFSVSINGIIQGYTVRTDQTNRQMATSFTIPGEGVGLPTYSVSPITITVRDQNGEVLSGREVSLKDTKGNLISNQFSDASGNATFSDKLMEGTFYDYYIGDSKIGQAMPGQARNAYVDTSVEEASATKQGFSFTATVLGEDGLTLSGKEVTLTDITDGPNGQKISVKTNAEGQAIFKDLTLSRNYGVSVEGSDQAYTVRTDQAGAKMSASFFSKGKGEKQPVYSSEALVVVVRNADAEGLAGQRVRLKDYRGQEVASGITDKDGKVTITKGLLDGTYYDISVNSLESIAKAMPGQERSVYLKDNQIFKKGDNPSKEISKVKDEVSDIHEADAGRSSSNQRELDKKISQNIDDQKTVKKPSFLSQSGAKQVNQKSLLPNTGEKHHTLLAWLSSVYLSVAAIIFLIKKRTKNKS